VIHPLVRRAAGGLTAVLLVACGPGAESDRPAPTGTPELPYETIDTSGAIAPEVVISPTADVARPAGGADSSPSERASQCVEAGVSVILRADALPARREADGEEELRRAAANVVATMGDLLDPASIQVSPAIRAFRVQAASEEAAEAVAVMLGKDTRVEAVEIDRCDVTAPPR